MQDTTIGRLYFLPVLIYSSRSLLHGCYVECVSFLYFVYVTVKTILIKIKIFLGVLPVSSKRIIRLLFFRKQDTIDRKSTRLNSSHVRISYAVFCLKKKKIIYQSHS